MDNKIKLNRLKQIINEAIKEKLNEDITYGFSFKGKKFKIRFDVNANPTKKGLKIQFIPEEKLINNPSEARQLINDLQIYLNQKLAELGTAADFDPDVPYQNVIGFTIKLGSLSNIILKTLRGNTEQTNSSSIDSNLNPNSNPNEKL